MQKGIEIGLGKKLAENLEAPFPAPHSCQPVMDDSNPHRLVISLYSEHRKKVVIARSPAMAGRRACRPKCFVPARRRGNLLRLFHGVYPERDLEILPPY